MPVKIDMEKLALIKHPIVECSAWGEGGECYFTLSMCPGCGSKPCQVQRDGLTLYTRTHPDNPQVPTKKGLS